MPIFALDFGDPYIDQIFENSKLVAEKLGLSSEQYLTPGKVRVTSVFHGLSQMS